MREPAQRKNRACIRPEISRTKTFGKIGVSNGLFFEKHLKYIYLNQKFVPFTVLDLSYLEKEKYDARFDNFFTGLKLSNSNKKKFADLSIFLSWILKNRIFFFFLNSDDPSKVYIKIY